MTITTKELAVLVAISESEYQDADATSESIIDRGVWAFSITNPKLTAAGVAGKAISGVVSSLVKKGLVGSQRDEGDDVVWIKRAGFDAMRAAQADAAAFSNLPKAATENQDLDSKFNRLTATEIAELATKIDAIAQANNYPVAVLSNGATPPEVCFIDSNSKDIDAVYQQGEMSPAAFYAWLESQLHRTAGRIDGLQAARYRQAVIRPAESDILNHYNAKRLVELAFRAMLNATPTLIESDITGKFETASETWRAEYAVRNVRNILDDTVREAIATAGDTDAENALQGLLDALTKWREALAESGRISFHNRSAAFADRLDDRRADAAVTNAEFAIQAAADRLESFNPERVGDVMELLNPAGDADSSVRDRLLEVGRLNKYGRAISAILGCKGIPVAVRQDLRRAAGLQWPRFTNDGTAIGIPARSEPAK